MSKKITFFAIASIYILVFACGYGIGVFIAIIRELEKKLYEIL